MSDAFDPYLQWLAIREGERPLNHYRLLGLDLFESDPDVVASAADRQMAHVRTYQSGEHAASSQQVLNELAQAKICLLKPQRKAEYDDQLRKKMKVVLPAKPLSKSPSLAAVPSSPQIVVESSNVGSDRIANYAGLNRRQNSPVPWIIAGVSVVVLIALVAVAATIGRKGDPEPDSGTVVAKPETVPNPPPELPRSAPEEPAVPEPPQVVPSEPAPWDRQHEIQPVQRAAAEIIGTQQVADALISVREALAQREYTRADLQLDQAARTDLTMQEREEIERLRRLRGLIGRFWEAVDRGLVGLVRGSSLTYRGVEVAVAEKSISSLTLRDEHGRTHDFFLAHSQMDSDLAVILAEQGLADAGPSMQGVIGTFFALDRDADILTAQKMWEEALAAGWPGDELLAEVELDYLHLLAVSPPTEPVEPDSEPIIPDEGSPLLEVPAVADVQAAQQQIRQIMQEQYTAATSPAGKKALAERLFDLAEQTEDNTQRYALLVESRDIATSVPDGPFVYRIIDRIASEFDIDATIEKHESLVALTQVQHTPESIHAVAQFMADLVMEAILIDQYDQANSIVMMAIGFARRRCTDDDKHRLTQLRQRVEILERTYGQVQEALATLETAPDDAEANYTVGWFLCAVKGQWEQGLPHLAQGSNEEIRATAADELAPPSTIAEKLVVADLWWEIAKGQRTEAIGDTIRDHAVTWYTPLLPDLTGLDKQRVTTLLREHSLDRAGNPDWLQQLVAAPWQMRWRKIINGDIRVVSLHFSPDGTVNDELRENGVWTLEGDTIVARFSVPDNSSSISVIRVELRGATLVGQRILRNGTVKFEGSGVQATNAP